MARDPTGAAGSQRNRFGRTLADLTATELAVARTAFAAAAATFADFQDEADSHYYRAASMTATETWHALTVETARVTAISAVEANQGGRLEEGDFEDLHQAIFAPVFGGQTLAVRRYEEAVTYGVVRGPRDTPDFSARQWGISARSLPKRLAEIAGDLSEAIQGRDDAVAGGQPRRIIDATRPAARAYCRLLAAHPFVDGNGRTAFATAAAT